MIGLVYSGGIESTYLLQTIEDNIQPVYVRYGFEWEKPEIEVAKENTDRIDNSNDLMVISIEHDDFSRLRKDGFEKDEQYFTYIHGRTLSIISNAAVELNSIGINEIYEGTLAGGEDETFPDSTKEFYSSLEETLSIGLGSDIKIRTPLRGKTKKEIIESMEDMELGIEDTLSCVGNSKRERCGECYKCKKIEKYI